MKQSDFTQEEELMIQRAFEDMLAAYEDRSVGRVKTERISQAFHFAHKAHYGVRRLSGEPYILHPIAVAKICASEIGLGSTSICSALLHDVVEDTDYTVDDIRNLFGDQIAVIVNGLTKISGGLFGDQVSEQAENFRKLLLTMTEDIRVVLIKIADRLHNMRTLGSQPKNKHPVNLRPAGPSSGSVPDQDRAGGSELQIPASERLCRDRGKAGGRARSADEVLRHFLRAYTRETEIDGL